MAVEFAHKVLAEAHNFIFAFAFGVEVTAALAAAHGEGGKGVFEDLFESEEFKDAEVYGRVEAQSAFVWSDGVVKLNPVSGVNLDIALVIQPWNLEDDDTVRSGDAFKDPVFLITGVAIQEFTQSFDNFLSALEELFFPRITVVQAVQHLFSIRIHYSNPSGLIVFGRY